MSEIEAGTTAAVESAPSTESAAPQTTESITANVIEQLDAADSASERPAAEARVDTADVTAQPVEPVKPVTAKELSEAAQFLLKQGHQAKKVDGRDTWLPHGTVEKMLDRYAEQHRHVWAGERSTLEGQLKEARTYLDEVRTDVTGDPKVFLTKLAQADPRYRAFLEPQTARQDAAPVVDDRPQPDIDLGNGQWTYSREQNEKYIEWKAKQLLDARLKPWEDQQKEAQQQAKQREWRSELEAKTQTQMQEAQTWPMFGTLGADLTPFQAEVLGEMQKESEACRAAGVKADGTPVRRPTMTVRQAYLEVHARHLAADDTTKRAKWLEEMNAAPRSTSFTRGSAEPTRARGARSTEDIARETIERMG